jgi:CPA1 family monovalent cation:H+ antiporter
MGIHDVEIILIILLFLAALVGIVIKRLHMPYTVGLVIVGLALAFFAPLDLLGIGLEELRSFLSAELILSIFVPPLVFEAAFHINFKELTKNLKIILVLAIPGLILTMFLVGWMVSRTVGIALTDALLFGALIAATDPVAVVALFRTLGVPKQLQILLEGESLFNDGTAIVMYNIMLSVIATGTFSFSQSVVDFLMVAGGGVLVGIIVGWIATRFIGFVNDAMLEITITLVAVYGSYLTAENFHFSGVLAVVAAGLVAGNLSSTRMSPTSKITLLNFWDYLAFLANTLVFLLIGLEIDLALLLDSWQAIFYAIIIVLAARAIVIYGFSRFFKSLNIKIQHVLYWGGLRGAVSLALVLSLPATLGAERDILQAMTFGVVLFTILIQGVSMEPLVKKLGFVTRSAKAVIYELNKARSVAAAKAYQHVEQLTEEGFVSDDAWEILERPMKLQLESRKKAVSRIVAQEKALQVTEINFAYREGLRVQRAAYSEMLSEGIIGEDVYTTLITEIDNALINEDINYADFLVKREGTTENINRLLITTILENDLADVASLLNMMGVYITTYDLEKQSHHPGMINIMIGMENGQEENVIRAIKSVTQLTPLARNELMRQGIPMTNIKQILVNGAAFYIFEIERYEVI